MRSFPGALAAAACLTLPLTLAVTLAVSAISSPVAFGDDGGHLKHRQQQVHTQVQQAEQDADDASAEVSSATQAVQRSEADLQSAYTTLQTAREHVQVVGTQLAAAQGVAAEAQTALDRAQAVGDQAQGALATARTGLAQAQAAAVAGRQRLQAQRLLTQQTVVGLYQSGSPELLALSGYLDSSSPSDLTRRLEYSQTLVEDQTSAFDDLHDAEVALLAEQEQADAAAQTADTAAQQADAAEQVVASAQADASAKLATAEAVSDQAVAAAAAATAAKAGVETTLEDRRHAVEDAKAARTKDLATLAELKQQEQHIKQLVLAAAAKDRGQGYVGASSGFLLPPMNGAELTSPFGYRIHPIYHYWGLHDGDDFAAPCGTPMQASADGTVIAASWSDVYGNRLYIDVGKVNGHAITVNYNHAVRYVVGVGDHVTRGQTVGYEGTTGWSTGCHTHFTVLQDGTPVDPMTYISGSGSG